MTDTEVAEVSSSPAPSSEDYIGCFSDMVGDRLLTTVTTDDALTPDVSVISCGMIVIRLMCKNSSTRLVTYWLEVFILGIRFVDPSCRVLSKARVDRP